MKLLPVVIREARRQHGHVKNVGVRLRSREGNGVDYRNHHEHALCQFHANYRRKQTRHVEEEGTITIIKIEEDLL